MSHLLADIRYGLRSLRGAPLFTTIAVASIGFAIAANTAVFTLVDQVLLRLLPARDADRLVQVSMSGAFYGGNMGDGTGLSYPMYVDLRDNNQVFAGMFSRFPVNVHLGFGGRSERVSGELVSGTYFPVLGVGAALGRTLTPDDDRAPGAHPLIVLSHGYWKSRFAGNPNVIGQTLTANGHAFTITGVADAGFDGTDLAEPAQIFVPMAMHSQFAPAWLKQDHRRFRWVTVFARLRDGVTREQAAAGLQPFFRSVLERETLEASFASASPESRRRYLENRIELSPGSQGRSLLREQLDLPLRILLAIVGGVLLIACANVANLLLARGVGRQREIALRLALGASRRRVVQQLLVEGLLLAALGGGAGLLLASWGAEFLIAAYSSLDNPLTISATPDPRIAAFTLALVGATGLLCGLVPALHATRPELAPTLKEGAASVLGSGRVGLRKLLVIGQVALSLLLLIGAGLFVRSLNRLLAVGPGFAVDRLVSFSLDLERNGYTGMRSKQLVRDVFAKIDESPGVQSSAYVFFGLLEGGGWGMVLTIGGRQPNPGEFDGSMVNAVSPGYFRTMEIPLVEGREFTAQDERTDSIERWPYRVGIVNETFAKRYLSGRRPVGVRVGLGNDPGTPTPIEIVGVVKDAKYTSIRGETPPQLFLPAQENSGIAGLTAYVRTTRRPDDTMAAIRRTVHEVDSTLPVFGVQAFENQLARSLASERLIASLSTVFSVLATLLAAIGLYGVMAYTVTRRTREIGIRVALGARGTDVALRIWREATVLVVVGLAAGFTTAWGLTRYVESQLYGVTPRDPWTMVMSVIGLSAIATVAVLIPARRAARIDPIVALRAE